MINVYIDGACTNNGQRNAVAGYGVFFAENDPRNDNGIVDGKQTNNTGELTAFIKAHEILKQEIHDRKLIHIYTDSEYVMKCVTTYGDKLKQNNWKTSNGKNPPNVDLVKQAYEAYQNSKISVRLHHIAAHTNKTDEHSIGNAGADRLACLATGQMWQSSEHVEDTKHHVPLAWISFHNKDMAKELGAKWDHKKKMWYVDADNENMDKLQELQSASSSQKSTVKDEKKHYINISYAKRGEAKANGARWDASVKSWYYTDNIKDEQKQALLKITASKK